MTVGCSACGRGFYDECELDDCPCPYHSPDADVSEVADSLSYTGEREVKGDKSRSFKDARSTGRKRAAMLYPFICDSCGHSKEQHGVTGNGSRTAELNTISKCTKELCDCDEFVRKPCEWRGHRNNGGGRYPIIGCGDGVQHDRHHGPIKDTMRNELGNVHLICGNCHQRWHQLNDPPYDEELALKDSHSPIPATEHEIAKNEIDWITGYYSRNYQLKTGKVKASD